MDEHSLDREHWCCDKAATVNVNDMSLPINGLDSVFFLRDQQVAKPAYLLIQPSVVLRTLHRTRTARLPEVAML